MLSFLIISAIAVAAAQASILPCGTGLPLSGCPVVSGVSSYPLGERVIANNCRCTKTIVRPKVSQCLVNVPTTRRVVQNSISNVVENIPYRTGSPYFGCGAPLDVCSTPGFGTVSPLGAGYGLGYCGLNNGVLGGDVIAPLLRAGCSY